MDVNRAMEIATKDGRVPMMTNEAFGENRHDPSMPYVKERDFMYEIRECDTCGRAFAVNKGSNLRNCCETCTQIWSRMVRRRPSRMRLFYYHTKLRRILGSDDISNPEFVDLTPSENTVYKYIKNAGWVTIADIVRGTGLKRPTVACAIAGGLKNANLLLKRKEIINKKVTYKWNIEEHVIYKKLGCPICLQHYFKINRIRNEMMCVACRAQWRIHDDGSFA